MKTLAEALVEKAGAENRPRVRVLCGKCAREQERWPRMNVRPEPAAGFLRNEAGSGGSELEPVCMKHAGECFTTFVRLADGWEEWIVQTVLQS